MLVDNPHLELAVRRTQPILGLRGRAAEDSVGSQAGYPGLCRGRPCVINVGTFERLNVGTFNVPALFLGNHRGLPLQFRIPFWVTQSTPNGLLLDDRSRICYNRKRRGRKEAKRFYQQSDPRGIKKGRVIVGGSWLMWGQEATSPSRQRLHGW
jgi:hypothetical protein